MDQKLALAAPGIAADFCGIKVPASKFVHAGRAARIKSGKYEGQEIKASLHIVGEEDVVLEIGSGIGLVGAVIAANAKPVKVASYEANPNLIPVIEELYALNGLTDRISVKNAVLVTAPDAPASLPFYLHKSYLGSSLLHTDSKRPKEQVEVPTSSFSVVCGDLKPTVLVMDIEGGELDLLRHADLSGFRAIVLEFHPKVYGPGGMRACKRFLRRAGFQKQTEVSTKTVWACIRTSGQADDVDA